MQGDKELDLEKESWGKEYGETIYNMNNFFRYIWGRETNGGWYGLFGYIYRMDKQNGSFSCI